MLRTCANAGDAPCSTYEGMQRCLSSHAEFRLDAVELWAVDNDVPVEEPAGTALDGVMGEQHAQTRAFLWTVLYAHPPCADWRLPRLGHVDAVRYLTLPYLHALADFSSYKSSIYTPGQSHPHARKSPGAISPAAGKCCARRNSPHSIAQTYTPTCCAEEVWSNMARPRPAWQLKVGPRRPCRRPSADAPSLGCHRPSAAPMRSDLDVPKVL